MKKYFVSCICFLALANFIIMSCATNDDAPESNVVVLPSIVTTSATIINQTTATCGGNLLSSGNGTILSRGLCYSTLPNPTTADSKIPKPGTLGTFTCAFTGLTAATTYYVRAYASNSAGTAYGEQITFTTTTTAIALPVVTTTEAAAIAETTAISGGNVTSIGGAALTARGICWSIAENPTTSSNVVPDAAATLGIFTSSITDLTPNTVYFVRAFATNSGGTGYGTQITFTTTGSTVAGLPVLTTTAASAITQTAASTGGNVTSDGGNAIIARGICWATTDNPSIANNTIPSTGTTGSFTSSLTGLAAGTTYFVRAFATNTTGTGYGNQISFTTTGGSTSGPSGGNAVCNGSQPTTVVGITSLTGKIWMDRNLGASRAATSAKDYNAYGCLYQWGRGNDDHASITWIAGQENQGVPAGTAVNGVTDVHSSSDTPGDALFIRDDQGVYDWRTPKNDDLWQGLSGINNPCPSGYRLPTQVEFEEEIAAYSITGPTSAYNSALKFPLAGDRAFDSGAVRGQGVDAFFWTSTIDGNNSFDVSITANGVYTDVGNGRSSGFSVRCIKN